MASLRREARRSHHPPLDPITGVAVAAAAPHALISLELAIDGVTFATKPPRAQDDPPPPSRMLTGCSSAKAATTATATTIASLPRRARTTSKPGAMARCAFFCGAVSIDPCSCSSGSSSGVPVFEGCLPRVAVCAHAAPAVEVAKATVARSAAASAAPADQSKLPVHRKAR